MPIVTLTMNPAIDKSTTVDRVLPDRKLRCKRPDFEPGGGGINVARVVQRLGGEALALYPAGGKPGEFFQSLLDDHGLNHGASPIKGNTRQNLMVYEKETGQQYRFGMPGPRLTEQEWQSCLTRVVEEAQASAAQMMVASGSLPEGVPQDFYARLADRCRKSELRLVVDTSGEALRQAVARSVFLIKPNLRELRVIAGEELEEESRQEKFVRTLVDEGRAEHVVLSLGAAGVLAAWKDGTERLRAPTVTIKSKVGAGDSTVAGIVLAMTRGWSFVDAVRYGVAAGAAAVMTPGSELCRKEDVERLYRKIRNSKHEIRNKSE